MTDTLSKFHSTCTRCREGSLAHYPEQACPNALNQILFLTTFKLVGELCELYKDLGPGDQSIQNRMTATGSKIKRKIGPRLKQIVTKIKLEEHDDVLIDLWEHHPDVWSWLMDGDETIHPDEGPSNVITRLCILKKARANIKYRRSQLPIDELDRILKAEPCEWYIIDSEANYCFWKWFRDPMNQKEHTLENISLLWGTSVVNVWTCEKRAMKKMVHSLSEAGMDRLEDLI